MDMTNKCFKVREVNEDDLEGLLTLYTQLHDNKMPEFDDRLAELWKSILGDSRHHILAGCLDKEIVSSCVIVIIPNLTHMQRPYALIENVITRMDCRKRGFASRLLAQAADIAAGEGCYKIMLLTGSREQSTLDFYERAGFNRRDKTGFIRWL